MKGPPVTRKKLRSMQHRAVRQGFHARHADEGGQPQVQVAAQLAAMRLKEGSHQLAGPALEPLDLGQPARAGDDIGSEGNSRIASDETATLRCVDSRGMPRHTC